MLGLLGVVLALVGIIWLVVTAIKTGTSTGDKVIWAIVNIIGCQPIGGIVFFIVKKQGMVPLLLLIVGEVIMWFGGAMTFTSSFGTP